MGGGIGCLLTVNYWQREKSNYSYGLGYMFKFLNRFKKGLNKTTKRLFGAVGGIFGFKELDESMIDSLEEALYEADFGVETTTEIIDSIKTAYKREKRLRGEDAAHLAAAILKRTLEGAEPPPGWIEFGDKPGVICLLGVNGAGKTTTTGKLAQYFEGQGKDVILGACDTFRAAANEQIQVWAKRLDVPVISSQHGADAAAVAYDSYESAKAKGKDILLLDTAGRLHNKGHLMEELAKIKRVLQKQNEELPHHSWLVVDGSMGSNSIEQAKVFHDKFGLTGVIITKLDGTSRGGAVVGIYRELKLPIYFVGLGEQAEDLQPFSIDNYVNAIFDIKQSEG